MVAVDFLRKSSQPVIVGLYKSAHCTRSLAVLSNVKKL
jgi:hypothetical protein